MNLDVLRTFSDGLGGMASAQNGGGGNAPLATMGIEECLRI